MPVLSWRLMFDIPAAALLYTLTTGLNGMPVLGIVYDATLKSGMVLMRKPGMHPDSDGGEMIGEYNHTIPHVSVCRLSCHFCLYYYTKWESR
jgi:hypothetical protein